MQPEGQPERTADSEGSAHPTTPVNPAPAIAALTWCADVGAIDEALAEKPPTRPSLDELRAIPLSVFREQMDRLLLGRNTEIALDCLLAMGVLDTWLPEVATMVGFGDGEWRHKDVWKHTKQVVKQSVPRIAVRWGALLHDIGKPKTRSIEPNGEVHFFGHSEVGAAMFRKRVARRVGIEGELYDRVHYLILHHLRASQYDRGWTDSAVRRFGKEMGDGLVDLLDLSRADITTKRPEKKKRGLQQISDLGARIRELQELDAKRAPLPKGVGTAIMKHFALPPSKRIGDLKDACEAAVDRGDLLAGQPDEYYVQWLEEHRTDFNL